MSRDEQGEGGGEDRVLVAEFALGLLDPAEHEVMRRRIAADPELRREYRLWRGRLGTLDEGFAEAAPPAGVLERIEGRLFPAAPAREGRARLWNTLGFWRGLAAAGFALAIVAVGVDFLPRPPLTGPELVAALEAAGSDVKFVAFYDRRAGTLRLAALSGSAVPDKDFELWAIEGKNAPISMGVIPMDKSNVAMPPSVKQAFGPGTVLAVTLEQKGGSPTGKAQGPVVAVGTAMAI